MSKAEEMQQIETALRENIEKVVAGLAQHIAHLGARLEWSMDDNFGTTEWVAGLAERCGLPPAGDQDDEALEFYTAAQGYES